MIQSISNNSLALVREPLGRGVPVPGGETVRPETNSRSPSKPSRPPVLDLEPLERLQRRKLLERGLDRGRFDLKTRQALDAYASLENEEQRAYVSTLLGVDEYA